jgi:adhesin/invasin
MRGALIALVCCGLLAASAGSALAEEAKFSFTGKEQKFKVPAGVTSVHVVAVGSQGANGGEFFGGPVPAGGLGAVVSGDLGVTAGEKLYVEVGGVTFNGGGSGANGGGGGGASDVRKKPSAEGEESLTSRLLVAAGGGGGGFSNCSGGHGGAGGNEEEAGHPGIGCAPTGGGGPGTSTKGGAGGEGPIASGGEGTLGAGGSSIAGGGGGGLYGGGGGGMGNAGAGGGGGSNLVPTGGPPATVAKAGEASSVTITYTGVPAHTTATSVKCSPTSLLAGQSTTCTATVKDEATSGATAPEGTVAFKTSGEGSFEGTCALKSATTSASSCSVTYKPSEATKQPERTDTITAEYEGDESHETSVGTTTVTVIRHATGTTVSCIPASLVAGGSTKCTATVEDKATSGATTPTGSVAFKTGGSGSFNEASCALAGSGATASCEVTYTPSATPKEPERTDTISAEYEGDEAHEGSKGMTTVTVISFTQTISGPVNGKLVVKAGQSVLLSSQATVNGGVTIEAGGALDVEGARINGELTANKATRLRVCGARLNGSGAASNDTGKVVIGEGTTGCPGNTINGPLTVTGNSAGVQIVGNTVNGSLTVTGNAGGTTVINNTIVGNLTVLGNTGTVVDKPNTVIGKTNIQ